MVAFSPLQMVLFPEMVTTGKGKIFKLIWAYESQLVIEDDNLTKTIKGFVVELVYELGFKIAVAGLFACKSAKLLK